MCLFESDTMDTLDLREESWIEETIEGIKVKIKVNPNSDCSALKGSTSLYLKVNISSSPEKGKANSEIIKLFSKILDLNESDVEISRGFKSAKKNILIKGKSKELKKKLINSVKTKG